MVTIAAFFYPLVLLFKYITGEFMVFVDLEQDEEGQNPNGEVRNL